MPDEPGHSSFTADDVNDSLSKSFKNVSTVWYQVNKNKVNELPSSSVTYHKQTFEQVLNSVAENYLKRVAPGQETEFLEILIGSDDGKNDNYDNHYHVRCIKIIWQWWAEDHDFACHRS